MSFRRVSCFMSYIYILGIICVCILDFEYKVFLGGGVVDSLCHSFSSGVASKDTFLSRF